MLNKQCTLCGRPANKEEFICRDCLESVHKRESIDILLAEIEEEQQQPEKTEENISGNIIIEPVNKSEPNNIIPVSKKPVDNRRRKKKHYTKHYLILSLGLLICVVLGFSFYLAEKDIQKEDFELNLWYLSIEENTPEGYSNYLRMYPQGRFNEDALAKIHELRTSEYLEWEMVKKSPDINMYYSFLNLYPNSPFKNDVAKIMDSLSWETALKENTAESYQYYLENVQLNNISGLYRGLAQERYDYLSQSKELEKEELEKVKEVIKQLFLALSKQEYNSFNLVFSKTITNFYGVRNKSAEVILRSIKIDMDKNKVKNLSYSPEIKSLQAHINNKGTIVVEIKVKKKIVYKTKKATESIDEIIHIDINSDMKIKSLYTKGKP